MFNLVIFLADLVAACVVAAMLTRIFELVGRLRPDDSGDSPRGGGGWRYRPSGPRASGRRPARGGPQAPLLQRPRVRR